MTRACLLFFALCLASVIAGIGFTHTQEGYHLDITVKTRTADGTEPLKGVDLYISGPEGTTGPGSIKDYHIKTDDSGKASLILNLPGKYTIRSEHPDYEPSTSTATLTNTKFPMSVSWTLRRKGVVTQYKLVVSVLTQQGQGIPDAEISVTGPAAKNGRTDPDGKTEITLPYRGEYTVHVSHPNFGEFEKSVTFTEAGQTKTVEFYFTPKSSGMQIEVTVINQDGDPVPGARVQFGNVSSRSTTTDFRGRASILIRNKETDVPNTLNALFVDVRDIKSKTDPLHLMVTHDDFEDGAATVTPLAGGFDRVYPVTVQLNRKLGSGIKVHVLVFEKGSHLPLMDAKVVMNPTEFKTTGRFSGSTDGDGRAILTARKPGEFDIVITRQGYDALESTVTLTNYEKHQFEFELSPKPGELGKMRRMLRVKVRAKDSTGKMVPVKNATVTVSSGQTGNTDAQGNMCLFHTEAPGESLNVSVTPPTGSGYKSKSDSVIVKANGTLFDFNKIQDAQFKEYLRKERERITKESPGDLSFEDNMDRVLDALGNSWGKEFSAPFAKAWEDAFGPQAVDNCTVTLDSSAASLDGDVIPKKGAVKIGEKVQVEVALISNAESADLMVNEKVELFGPGNKLITSNVANRTLKPAEYSRRYFDIVCQEPGTYQVKSTVTGPNGLAWTDKASFVVEKGSSSTAGQQAVGVFKLTDKVVGKIDGTGIGPYGKWTASASEGSFTSNYETTTEYDNHAAFSANWSTPPPQLRPGDIIELTCTCTGKVWGRDAAFVGLGVGWGVEGSAEVVLMEKPFCGRASDGKDYPSASGKVKFKVGSGGKIKVWAWRNGVWGGDTGGGMHCEYTYIYEAPETGNPGASAKGKTTMTTSGGG